MGSLECAEWATIRLSNADEIASGTILFNTLDDKVDNGDGWSAASVRFLESNADNNYILYKGRTSVR